MTAKKRNLAELEFTVDDQLYRLVVRRDDITDMGILEPNIDICVFADEAFAAYNHSDNVVEKKREVVRLPLAVTHSLSDYDKIELQADHDDTKVGGFLAIDKSVWDAWENPYFEARNYIRTYDIFTEEGLSEVTLEASYVCADCKHQEWRPQLTAIGYIGHEHPIKQFVEQGHIPAEYKAAAEKALETADLPWRLLYHLTEPILEDAPKYQFELRHKISGSMEQTNYSWFRNLGDLKSYLLALGYSAAFWGDAMNAWLVQLQSDHVQLDLADKGILYINRLGKEKC